MWRSIVPLFARVAILAKSRPPFKPYPNGDCDYSSECNPHNRSESK